jgi:hypothetical protein
MELSRLDFLKAIEFEDEFEDDFLDLVAASWIGQREQNSRPHSHNGLVSCPRNKDIFRCDQKGKKPRSFWSQSGRSLAVFVRKGRRV